MAEDLTQYALRWDRDQDGPVLDAVAVVPNDATDLPSGIARGIYVGVAGDVSFLTLKGATVLLKAAAAGYHPIAMRRVRATATTATNILALY